MVTSFPTVKKGSLYFSSSNQQRATVHCTLNLPHPLEALHRESLFVNKDADFKWNTLSPTGSQTVCRYLEFGITILTIYHNYGEFIILY